VYVNNAILGQSVSLTEDIEIFFRRNEWGNQTIYWMGKKQRWDPENGKLWIVKNQG